MLRVAVMLPLLAAGLGARPGLAAPADEQRALELFQQSELRYREGKFAEALELLERAYALRPEPVLLYNMGRALEGMGDLPRALEVYEGYLRADPAVPDRPAIEARLDRLRQRLAAERAPPPAVLEAAPPPAPPPPSRGPSRLPWVVAGAGAAAAGVGVVFGVRARSLHDRAVAEEVQVDAFGLQAEAQASARRANLAFGIGGALAGVGLAFAVLELLRTRR